MPALEVSGVTMAFGGAQVLSDVSLSVEPACVTGIIGPNGAGKTTLFNVISGLLAQKSGKVRIEETDVTRSSPATRARRGLARTYQRLELFTSLTVRDNVRVAGEIRRCCCSTNPHRDRPRQRPGRSAPCFGSWSQTAR